MTNQTITQLQNKVANKELTYEQITAYYLDRIELYNPEVNAIAELNPNALEQAKALDIERQTKGLRSPIHGMPILLKDNINVASDGLHTTAGAYVFKDLKAPYDATIVSKLREAGAVILGKTNLSEFANFISETSPNGFSALKGQVINPHGGQHDVGGSSSGSGVAVACDFCQVAIGTETSGSIISPSFSNGIIGLKPSVGVASRYGIIPISGTQDIPGPMAKHIEDIVLVQQVLESFDPNDMSTSEWLKLKDKRFESIPKVKKTLRLGIFIDPEEKNNQSPSRVHFAEALKKLEAGGVKTCPLSFDPKAYTIDWDVLYYEFPRDMAAYLQTVAEEVTVSSLKDIIDFHHTDLETYVPYDQKQFEISVAKSSEFEKDYGRALRDSFNYGSLIDQWLEEEQLDAVCFVNCDGIDIGARNGHPSITFPIGLNSEGKPTGFTMTGPMFSEPKLIAITKELMPIIGKQAIPNLKETPSENQ